MSVPAQLVLPIGSDEIRNFSNFIAPGNPGLLAYLRAALARHTAALSNEFEGIVLWGASGVGKTHLLVASGQYLLAQGGRSVYLKPETKILHAEVEAASVPVYFLDDLDSYLGSQEAESRLLTMLEGLKRQNALVIMAAPRSIKGLDIQLADLHSRLQALDSFEVHALDDEQKREVVRQRAYIRGMLLSDEVLNWLFTHTSRDLGVLLDLLEQVDVLSLSQQRKVTIPLLKTILET